MSSRSLKAMLVVSLAFNLAVVGTVAVGLVVREEGPGDPVVAGRNEGIPIDDHGKHLSKCIGLSGKKAKCFEQVMAGTSGEAGEIKGKLESERGDLFHLLQAKEPDEEAIMTKVESIAALQSQLEKLLVKRLVDSRAVLGPEEDEKLLYLIRCSMRPGCVGKENCPYKNGKEGKE